LWTLRNVPANPDTTVQVYFFRHFFHSFQPYVKPMYRAIFRSFCPYHTWWVRRPLFFKGQTRQEWFQDQFDWRRMLFQKWAFGFILWHLSPLPDPCKILLDRMRRFDPDDPDDSLPQILGLIYPVPQSNTAAPKGASNTTQSTNQGSAQGIRNTSLINITDVVGKRALDLSGHLDSNVQEALAEEVLNWPGDVIKMLFLAWYQLEPYEFWKSFSEIVEVQALSLLEQSYVLNLFQLFMLTPQTKIVIQAEHIVSLVENLTYSYETARTPGLDIAVAARGMYTYAGLCHGVPHPLMAHCIQLAMVSIVTPLA